MRRVFLDAGFVLLLAMMILLLEPAVSASVLFSAAVHECGHLMAIRLCGGRVKSLRLCLSGAELAYDGRGLSYGREAVCALAGPAAGLGLALALSLVGRLTGAVWLYLPAGASLILGLFNLLPARALDGGRAVYMLICAKRGLEAAEKTACVLSCASALVILALGAIVAYETRRNFTLLIIGVWMLLGERRLTCRA